MSYRNPREQGEKLPLDQRTGLGQFPPLRGVKKSRNPASLADTQFDHLLNVRIKKGVLRERGGLVKAATNAFPGVQGVHDASDVGAATSAIYVLPPPPGIYQISNAPASGSWFSRAFDETITTRYTLPTPFPVATFARPFTAAGKLVIGSYYTAFKATVRLYQWDLLAGVTVAHEIVWNYYPNTNGILAISCGVEFGGNFYFSAWYQQDIPFGVFPQNHHLLIYRWDGVNAPVLELDHTFVHQNVGAYAEPGVCNTWALYSDGLDVFAINKAAEGAEGAGPTPGNTIKKRNGGVWDALTMPVGYLYFGVPLMESGVSYGSVVRYQGATYIAGHVQDAVGPIFTTKTLKILKWDGVSLTEVWSRTNVGMTGVINLFVADAVLYYNYSNAGSAIYRTGSFDGTTWNDTAKIWTAAPQSIAVIPYNVVDYAGELWCTLGNTALYKTSGRVVTGLWSPTTPDADNAVYLDLVD